MFLWCRGDIVKYCLVDGDALGGAATGFGVGNLESLKMEYYCDFIAGEALENIESIWKSDLNLMV